jgi:hypothetical protein
MIKHNYLQYIKLKRSYQLYIHDDLKPLNIFLLYLYLHISLWILDGINLPPII